MQSFMSRVALALAATLSSPVARQQAYLQPFYFALAWAATADAVAAAGSSSLSLDGAHGREAFCKVHDDMWQGKEGTEDGAGEPGAQEGVNSARTMLNSVGQNRSVLQLVRTRPKLRAHRDSWPNLWDWYPGSRSEKPPEGQQNIQLMGLFDSGTNLLRALIEANFPRAQVRVHDMYKPAGKYWQMAWQPNCAETANQICSFWKHANLDVIKKRSPKRLDEMHELDVVGVALVRDPLSWLQSIRSVPYAFGWPPNDVYGVDWFRNPIAVPKVYYGGEPLVRHPSLVDVWNNQSLAYENLGSYGFKRFLAIRYEDLVMNTERVMADVAAVLGVPAPEDVKQVDEPAKTGVCGGREDALSKILVRGHLNAYKAGELRSVCGLLDVDLMRRHGYVDCDDVAPGDHS